MKLVAEFYNRDDLVYFTSVIVETTEPNTVVRALRYTDNISYDVYIPKEVRDNGSINRIIVTHGEKKIYDHTLFNPFFYWEVWSAVPELIILVIPPIPNSISFISD